MIGAHYDHLGYGGAGSMKPNVRAIHHGADDNASGTAAVLLAAEKMSAELSAQSNRRTVVFILFSGEEVGLAGSSWFVAHTPFPFENVRAMVNLDMVGAMKNDELIVFGTESAKEWSAAINPMGEKAGIKVLGRGDGYGPSDQSSFYGKQVPVLHLFTGAHERYHTPEDTADKVNAEGAAKVVDFTAQVGEALALGRVTPTYARSAAAPPMEGDRRGYGSYLGTVPDFRAMESSEGGVLLGDVRTGGPADLAGIKGGDRIVAMAGTKIANLYDMTYALEDHKPGETIDVVIERGGEKKTLKATLGERRGTPPEQSTSPGSSPHGDSAEPTPSPPAGGEGRGEGAAQLSCEWHPASRQTLRANLPRRAPPRRHPPAHFRRRERRGLLVPRRPQGHLPVEPARNQVRPGIHHGSDDRRLDADLGRQGPHDLRLLPLPAGRPHHLFVDGRRRRRLPAPGRPVARLRLARLQELRHLHRQPRRLEQATARPVPRLRRRGDVEPKGGQIVFTSDRDGDLDLYLMDEDGTNVKRLTNTPGYDGGAFFSPDGKEITWRASRPEGAELEEYKALLKQGLIKPTRLDIYVMNVDGTNVRQITNNRAANFCPFFTPNGKRIMWSSNVGDPKGREFDLWMAPKNGGEAERITTAPGFDGFPHFSPDGKWLVWASNRADPPSHETNLFIARWVE